ncbi:MAG: YebC/PmpR family DNA-binding regulatory protein [Myxococcota bacterium]|jgi:YebC/PmpR family DNA-binding regulatory protein
MESKGVPLVPEWDPEVPFWLSACYRQAMSGHSKWSTIKHKKAATDAKRGKIFSKLIKEVTVAARLGGADESGNPRLRSAIAAARAANMPKDNMERAIKKGSGDLEGVEYMELTYEGYGPGGVAVFVEVLTDNKNRSVMEVRHAFSKAHGNLGQDGSVAWMFERKGQIIIESEEGKPLDEDTVMMAALEAGAEDMESHDGTFIVTCGMTDLYTVREGLEDAGLPVGDASLVRLPSTTVECNGKMSDRVARLIDKLEDLDDVQDVFHNAELEESDEEE